jgi:hypothetical protein
VLDFLSKQRDVVTAVTGPLNSIGRAHRPYYLCRRSATRPSPAGRRRQYLGQFNMVIAVLDKINIGHLENTKIVTFEKKMETYS